MIITEFVGLAGPLLASESLYHVGMRRPPTVVFTGSFSSCGQMELQKRVAPLVPWSCKHTLTRVGAPEDIANTGQQDRNLCGRYVDDFSVPLHSA